MAKVHGSKRTRHANRPTFSIVPWCPFCGSTRVAYEDGDDDGPYVAVKCAACEACGPHVRVRIWEGSSATDVTDVMRDEATAAWNAIFDQIPGLRARILVDSDGSPIRRRRRPAKAKAPVVPAPSRSAEHQIHTVAPSKATNGHNGHHNGHGAGA